MACGLSYFQNAWTSVAGMVNKTDNTQLVPTGALGQSTVDQRIIKIKDKNQRRDDAVRVLQEIQNKPSMLWISVTSQKESKYNTNVHEAVCGHAKDLEADDVKPMTKRDSHSRKVFLYLQYQHVEWCVKL